jgi:photosystem II stability/assembly factor-like uncharacterized protein
MQVELQFRAGLVALVLAACTGGGSDDTGGISEPLTGGAGDTSGPGATTQPDPTTGPDGTTSTTADPTTPTGDPGTTQDPATTDGSSDDTGPPPVETASVFIAQGHYGRTTISCDDGKTWIQNRSEDDGVRCFEDGLDCDHNAFAGRGIAWGDGTFVLTWGWGAPGTVARTRDAATFETVLTDTPTFADLAFGNGRFVANAGTVRVSDDLGVTWQDGGALNININYRAIEFTPHDGGVFIVTGESGDQRAIVRSTDGGATWAPASERPEPCATYSYGMAYGGGAVILASGQGDICRSTDGGDTWQHTEVSDAFSSPPVWNGAEFSIYDGATLHRSADGVTWASETIAPDNIRIGALARSPEGTMVAANAGWMTWYEKQQFFRSTDGKTWEVLPPGAFVGSHPIYFIAHGTVTPGAGCPAN